MNLASSLILRIGRVFGFVHTVYHYARVDAGAWIQAKESSAPLTLALTLPLTIPLTLLLTLPLTLPLALPQAKSND